MGRPRKDSVTGPSLRGRPATNSESREKQLIALAMDRIEELLRDGSAPVQLLLHFAKAASSKAYIEQQIMEGQRDLILAKTEAIKAQKRSDELFEDAIAAMKRYSGHADDYDDDDEDV